MRSVIGFMGAYYLIGLALLTVGFAYGTIPHVSWTSAKFAMHVVAIPYGYLLLQLHCPQLNRLRG